ncbi:hypothetical protein ACXET9_09865 [Brachybacterium sp. DNPG3]
MSTPSQRVHEATRRLLDLLVDGEALSAEAVDARAELAIATAAAGHLEDAFYQGDELLKDVQREHGAEGPGVDRARAAVAEIEDLAREQLARDASGADDGEGPAA